MEALKAFSGFMSSRGATPARTPARSNATSANNSRRPSISGVSGVSIRQPPSTVSGLSGSHKKDESRSTTTSRTTIGSAGTELIEMSSRGDSSVADDHDDEPNLLAVPSYHISSDSFKPKKLYGDDALAGIVLYVKDGRTRWQCNDVRCRTGFLIIKKIDDIEQITSRYVSIYGKIYKSVFACDATEDVIASGFAYIPNRGWTIWRSNVFGTDCIDNINAWHTISEDWQESHLMDEYEEYVLLHLVDCWIHDKSMSRVCRGYEESISCCFSMDTGDFNDFSVIVPPEVDTELFEAALSEDGMGTGGERDNSNEQEILYFKDLLQKMEHMDPQQVRGILQAANANAAANGKNVNEKDGKEGCTFM